MVLVISIALCKTLRLVLANGVFYIEEQIAPNHWTKLARVDGANAYMEAHKELGKLNLENVAMRNPARKEIKQLLQG